MITRNTIESLEFKKLLKAVASFAHSSATVATVMEISPLKSIEEIQYRFSLIREIRLLSQRSDPIRLSNFPDISTFITNARKEGAVLEASELSLFIPVMDISFRIAEQINKEKDVSYLKGFTEPITGHPEILRLLRKSVDREGNVLDTASNELMRIRSHIRRIEINIRKKLEEIINDPKVSSFLQDNFITMRSGRWVIPVRMDSKGQVPGIVHDVSKSGETAFVEPLKIINLSNELENLKAEERAESIRVLKYLTAKIRENADSILSEYRRLVDLDMLYCIAALANMLRMNIPEINGRGNIILQNARHPILLFTLEVSGVGKVVPLDVQLGGQNTVMVITGANAGGKTIAIKTIGILTLMALSGMPVPADSSSSFPFLNNILVDIGDEQSIENSLSTFSAHIANISNIIKLAGPGKLILIDELGTGTDPDEGAALSCAILKEIGKSGALVFATTHLTGIKAFVHKSDGMLNASMEFDRKTLSPLYRLRVGEPGQSHAFETASKYGLPDNIIASAKEMLGGIKVEFDSLIADLNEKRTEYERLIAEIQNKEQKINELEKIAEEKISAIDNIKKEMILNARKEALDIISSTKRQMNALLDEIKKQEKQRVREALKKTAEAQKIAEEKISQLEQNVIPPLKIEDINVGDTVFVTTLGYDATVIDLNHRQKRLKLRAGGKDFEVPLFSVMAKKGKQLTKEERKYEGKVADNENISSSLNIIGKRVDDALSRLEPFLNHASLAGLREVMIIHGIGKSILLKAVHEHLYGHPLVNSFRLGEPSEGGRGITIVTLI